MVGWELFLIPKRKHLKGVTTRKNCAKGSGDEFKIISKEESVPELKIYVFNLKLEEFGKKKRMKRSNMNPSPYFPGRLINSSFIICIKL